MMPRRTTSVAQFADITAKMRAGRGDEVSETRTGRAGGRISSRRAKRGRVSRRAEISGGGVRTHDGDVELEGDVLEELEAVHVGHVDVAEDDVEVVASLAKRLERLGASHERRHWGAEGEGVV